MMPILHSPGVMMPGQFGPMSRDFFPAICAFTRIMSIDRNSFRDANHQLHTGIDRFQNSIGRARRRNENHRDIAAGFLARFRDGVEHRNLVLELLSALSRRDAGDDIGARTPCIAWHEIHPALPVIPCTQRRVFLSTRTDM